MWLYTKSDRNKFIYRDRILVDLKRKDSCWFFDSSKYFAQVMTNIKKISYEKYKYIATK